MMKTMVFAKILTKLFCANPERAPLPVTKAYENSTFCSCRTNINYQMVKMYIQLLSFPAG